MTSQNQEFSANVAKASLPASGETGSLPQFNSTATAAAGATVATVKSAKSKASKPTSMVHLETVLKQTPELCEQAILRDPTQIHKVARSLQSPYLFEMAFKNHGCKFSDIPRSMLVSAKFCLLAVKRSYENLSRVPPKLITKEMCDVAFAQSPSAFMYIPDDFHTPEMELAAVTADAGMLKYVNRRKPFDNFAQICAAAVKTHGSALCLVPKRFITLEMCETAIKSTPNAFVNIPEEFQTEHICDIAVAKDPTYANFIHNKQLQAKYQKS